MTVPPAPPLDTATFDEGIAAGFIGSVVDPTLGDEYALPGGATPETDATAKAAAKTRADALVEYNSGVGPAPAPSS